MHTSTILQPSEMEPEVLSDSMLSAFIFVNWGGEKLEEIQDKMVELGKGLTMFCPYLLVPLVNNTGNGYSLYVLHFLSSTNILKFLPVCNLSVCLRRMRKLLSSCHAMSVAQPPSAWSQYVCLM